MLASLLPLSLSALISRTGPLATRTDEYPTSQSNTYFTPGSRPPTSNEQNAPAEFALIKANPTAPPHRHSTLLQSCLPVGCLPEDTHRAFGNRLIR